MIFFDLEFYVPTIDTDRLHKHGTLVFNPTNSNHLILGGEFWCKPLNQPDTSPLQIQKRGLWLWQFTDEKALLTAIFTLFMEEWQMIQAEHVTILNKRIKDMVTCGFAIGRIDLPVLYIKCHHYKIAPASQLFEIFLKTKVIDLSNTATFLFPEDPTLYPKTMNEVSQRLLSEHNYKASGKDVWHWFDQGSYDRIQIRCQEEVENIIKIYQELIQNIQQLPHSIKRKYL